MTVAQLRAYLREHWQRIKAELLTYDYHPQAVLKVEIPKLGGKWNVGSSSGRCRHERIGQRSEVGRKSHRHLRRRPGWALASPRKTGAPPLIFSARVSEF